MAHVTVLGGPRRPVVLPPGVAVQVPVLGSGAEVAVLLGGVTEIAVLL